MSARGSVERWVPGVRALRTYQRAWLRPDLSPGIVLAAILVPQGMAYAQLAGLPAVDGPVHDDRLPGRLRAVRALAGARAGSRLLDLAADPRGHHAAAGGRRRRPRRSRWRACSAILVGLTEIGLGLGKLGFVADLLSKEVQVGYMNGLAITIIVGQLPKLFGFSTSADSFLKEVRVFFEGLDQTDATTLLVGLAVLALLLVLPRITRRVPAVLVAVVAATVVSAVFEPLEPRRQHRRGRSPRGFPRRASRGRTRSDVGPLLLAAVGITLVSLTDTIATATSFAARRGEEVEPNQEMIGMGAANIAAGLLPGLRRVHQRLAHGRGRTVGRPEPAHGPGRRGAGGRAAAVRSTRCSPTCPSRALAAVVIVAALSLMDLAILRRYLRGAPQRAGGLAGGDAPA